MRERQPRKDEVSFVEIVGGALSKYGGSAEGQQKDRAPADGLWAVSGSSLR